MVFRNDVKVSEIPSSYLALLLKISAINADFLPDSEWPIIAVGNLLEESFIIGLFDYDDVRFISNEFIETPYQWLYVYQQFANACHIVHQIQDESLNTVSWQYFGEKNWSPTVSNKFIKYYAQLLIEDFYKLCEFPDLTTDWQLLFKILSERNFGWKDVKHPTAKALKYDDLRASILDEHDKEINWFDILSLSIPSEAYGSVKCIKGLRFSLSNDLCLVQSLVGKDLDSVTNKAKI